MNNRIKKLHSEAILSLKYLAEACEQECASNTNQIDLLVKQNRELEQRLNRLEIGKALKKKAKK